MSYQPLSPQGRVIMVSGSNRGIGRAIAERLCEQGYRLSLGARDTAKLAPLLQGVEPERVLAHAYDAREPGAAQSWVEATAACFGRIDGVVNNAGVIHRFTVEDADESPLDDMWEVNTKAPLRVIRAAFPYLKAAGSGRVVNIVSLSGKRVAGAGMTGYCMSKYAAAALTHAVRYSGWDAGVRATAICPGYVATDMTAKVNMARDDMIHPGVIAQFVATVLSLPNPASVVEIPINCRLEHSV